MRLCKLKNVSFLNTYAAETSLKYAGSSCVRGTFAASKFSGSPLYHIRRWIFSAVKAESYPSLHTLPIHSEIRSAFTKGDVQ